MVMMEIRKAKKGDFKEYLKLKREEEKDLSKRVDKRISYPKDNVLKKEFNKSLSSNKSIILVVEKNKELIGYLHGSYFRNPYNKGGYVEDIFVLKKFRRIGIANKLIRLLIRNLRKKKYDIIQLSANVKNKEAIKLYKKLNFELYHYDFKKKIK